MSFGNYEPFDNTGQLVKLFDQFNQPGGLIGTKKYYFIEQEGRYGFSNQPLPGYKELSVYELKNIFKYVLGQESDALDLATAQALLKNVSVITSSLDPCDLSTNFFQTMVSDVSAIVNDRERESKTKASQAQEKQNLSDAIERHPQLNKAIDDFAKGNGDEDERITVFIDALHDKTAVPLVLHRFADFRWSKGMLSKLVTDGTVTDLAFNFRFKLLGEIFKQSPSMALILVEFLDVGEKRYEEFALENPSVQFIHGSSEHLAGMVVTLERFMGELRNNSQGLREVINEHLEDITGTFRLEMPQFFELVMTLSVYYPAILELESIKTLEFEAVALLEHAIALKVSDPIFLRSVILAAIQQSPKKSLRIINEFLPQFPDSASLVKSILSMRPPIPPQLLLRAIVPFFKKAPEEVMQNLNLFNAQIISRSFSIADKHFTEISSEKLWQEVEVNDKEIDSNGSIQERGLCHFLSLLSTNRPLSSYDLDWSIFDDETRLAMASQVLSSASSEREELILRLFPSREDLLELATFLLQNENEKFLTLYCASKILQEEDDCLNMVYQTIIAIEDWDVTKLPDATVAKFSKEQKFEIISHNIRRGVTLAGIEEIYKKFNILEKEQCEIERSFLLSNNLRDGVEAILKLYNNDVIALDLKIKLTNEEKIQFFNNIFVVIKEAKFGVRPSLNRMQALPMMDSYGHLARTLSKKERYEIALKIIENIVDVDPEMYAPGNPAIYDASFAFLQAGRKDNEWSAKFQDCLGFIKFVAEREQPENKALDAAFESANDFIAYLENFHAERNATVVRLLKLFTDTDNLLQWHLQTGKLPLSAQLLASQAQLMHISMKEIDSFFKGIAGHRKTFKDSKKVQELLSFMGKIENYPPESKVLVLNQIFLGKEDYAQRLKYINLLLGNMALYENKSYTLVELKKLVDASLLDFLCLEGSQWKDAKDFHERYQAVEQLFEARVPGALLTYSAKIGERPDVEKKVLREAFGSFVDALLKDTLPKEGAEATFPAFVAMRYDTPHLNSEPMQKSGVVAEWKKPGISLELTKLSNPYFDNLEDIFRGKFKDDINLLEREEQTKPFREHCGKFFELVKENGLAALQKQYEILKEDFAALKRMDIVDGRYIDAMQRFFASVTKAKAHINAETSVVRVSDNPLDLFLAARETNGCMSILRESEYNKALLGYVLEGEVKGIFIPDSKGKSLARAMIKLLYNEQSNEPILLLEKPYDDGNGTYESFYPLLLQCAQQYAEKLGKATGKKIVLVTKDVALFHASGKYDTGSGTLSNFGRSSLPEGNYHLVAYNSSSDNSGPGKDRAPFKYSDALRNPNGRPPFGFTSGPFDISGNFAIVN